MASPSAPPVLAERADIHKSCKSIETLLNFLNEYCEAVGAVVSLQKKLAKSLRETAGLKVTGDIASNAMQASAAIFEGLSDVDSKFSKIADREYDAISTEVKKWFKKLAKEEKAHDERVAVVNAKIKQAGLLVSRSALDPPGQAYEKKAKRKNTDASDEHTRYINLISTLGPEVTQTKYNHTLSVNQKHTATTYSVAASLARLADAEWQKSCECIRRFSPTVGPLVQWRALCEGGWEGPVPADLPNLDDPNTQSSAKKDNDYDSTDAAVMTPPRPASPLKTIQEDTRQETSLEHPAPDTANHPPTGLLRPPASRGRSPVPSSSSTENLAIQRSESPSRSAPPSPLKGSPSIPHDIRELRNAPPQSGPASHPTLNYDSSHQPPERLEPPPSLTGHLDMQNTGSIRSLSAFPSPPTHLPQPPQRHQQTSISQTSSSNASYSNTNQTGNVAQVRFVSGSSSGSGGPRPFAESPVSDQGFPSQVQDQSQRRSERQEEDESASPSSTRTRTQSYSRVAPPPQPQPQPPPDQFTNSTVPLEIKRPVPITARSSNSILTSGEEPEIESEFGGRERERTYIPGAGDRSNTAVGGAGKGHISSVSLDRRPLGRPPSQGLREDHLDDGREFGVGVGKVRSYAGIGSGGGYNTHSFVERTDTGTSSNGSIVAAMRNRYSSNPTVPTSAPPHQQHHHRESRELPRIPLSVNNLAARYERDGPVSPPPHGQRDPTRTFSPSNSSNPPPSHPPMSPRKSFPASNSSAAIRDRDGSPGSPIDTRNGQGQGQGLNRAPSFSSREGWRSKEQELKERERELEIRERELRERLQGTGGPGASGSGGGLQPVREDSSAVAGGSSPSWLRPRERRTSLKAQLQRPLSQMDLDDIDHAPGASPNANPRHTQRVSFETPPGAARHQQHLVPPPSGSNVPTPPSSNSPLHSPGPGQRRISPLSSPRLSQQHLQQQTPPLSPGRYERRISTDRLADGGRDRYGHENSSTYSNANSSSASSSQGYQRREAGLGVHPRLTARGGSSGGGGGIVEEPHAPYCGCESCSVSKYKSPSSTSLVQSPQSPSSIQPSDSVSSTATTSTSKYGPGIEGKPPKEKSSKPGWIRRLSMPVGQAFSLSSSDKDHGKKHAHNQSTSSISSILSNNNNNNHHQGAGLTRGASTSSSLYSMDPKRNMSAVALRSSTSMLGDVQEDGRLAAPGGGAPARPGTAGGATGNYTNRRSYDVGGGGGMGNRSMTNLNSAAGGGRY